MAIALYKSKSWLTQQRAAGKTITQIAAICQSSPQTIQNWLIKLGIEQQKRTW